MSTEVWKTWHNAGHEKMKKGICAVTCNSHFDMHHNKTLKLFEGKTATRTNKRLKEHQLFRSKLITIPIDLRNTNIFIRRYAIYNLVQMISQLESLIF